MDFCNAIRNSLGRRDRREDVRVIESSKYSVEHKRWYLEAVADAKRKWMAPIEPVPFFIGRDETCNLKLTDNQVSRRHSMISKSGDYLWICDLESTNGTFVNQKKIEQADLSRRMADYKQMLSF